MKRLLLPLTLLFVSISGLAQANFYTGFDEGMEKYYPRINKENAVYVVDLQRPQWADGINGRALDLSENAVLRKPLALDSLETPLYGEKDNLTVKVWVKTIKGALQGTPIIGNLPDDEKTIAGWKISTQETGAWEVTLSDGKNRFTYKPNGSRQLINDGEWHQLAFCLNRQKEEVWFYFDGINVAIYNISDLGNISNNKRTIVGGTDEYWEWGSSGQWTAFNGYLDEVSIKNSFDTWDSIEKDYTHYKTSEKKETLNSPLRVMVWNIWHGGRRYGKHVGVQRVVETIKEAQPDIVGLIETYGSGEIIADALGYHFYLISSNLSIMSRFPIKETIKAFRPFNFGGAIIDLGNGQELAFLDTWLHYKPDYWSSVVKEDKTASELIKEEGETRYAELKKILQETNHLVNNSSNVPVIMLGDFNSGSHLDWTEETKGMRNNYVVEWPVSKKMEDIGFKDSFRELHINPLLDPGFTWTPRAATSSTKYGLRDRIDYIYYKGNLNPIESKVIDYHPIMFPSDHAAVITVFEMN